MHLDAPLCELFSDDAGSAHLLKADLWMGMKVAADCGELVGKALDAVDGRHVLLSGDRSLGCGSKSGAVWPQANAGTKPRPGKARWVGRHRARCGADQELGSDRLKIGAEMHRALVDQDFLRRRLDADIAIHRLIGKLRLMRGDDHADIADS